MLSIDLNCDLGEGFTFNPMHNQEEILQYVSSINIACGYHSGDPTVMHETVKSALKHKVKIGAHPGLPDILGFGRRNMEISPRDAYNMIIYQIGALQGFLSIYRTDMHHVKPHGALYNMAAKDQALAEAIAQAVYDISPNLILYGLSGSELNKAGEKLGLATVHEVFADRTYQNNGNLTSRQENNAIIFNEKEALQQVLRLVQKNEVVTTDGSVIALKADSICVHGDEIQALHFVKTIVAHLQKNNITISSFST